MSEWSVWSQCSCESQRQQRYRVALSPATRGQQCTPVETQSRTCSLSQCDGELTTMEENACERIKEACLSHCSCAQDALECFISWSFASKWSHRESSTHFFERMHIIECVWEIDFIHVDTVRDLLYVFSHIYRLWSPICVLSMWGALWEAVRSPGPWRSVLRRQRVYTGMLLPTGEFFIRPCTLSLWFLTISIAGEINLLL